MTDSRTKNIVFAGGGTMGSVTPLLAVATFLTREKNLCLFWLGTYHGPEKAAVTDAGLVFQPLVAGKWRRYFSWRNLLTPLEVLSGFFQAWYWLMVWRPGVVAVAGAFVAVPVAWAAWLLKIPVLVHQQDLEIGLANRLMFPVARVITVSLKEQVKQIQAPRAKVVLTGNPIRPEILRGSVKAALDRWRLSSALPTILIFGGGTGAAALNKLIKAGASQLVKHAQIIHLTGRGKELNVAAHPRYRQFDFLNVQEMADAYALADLIICRAGFNTLSELMALGKPAVVIPMPGTHQAVNAAYLAKHRAAAVLAQTALTPELLTRTISDILAAPVRRRTLTCRLKNLMPPDSAKKISSLIGKLIVSSS